jgi:hypothetical protein
LIDEADSEEEEEVAEVEDEEDDEEEEQVEEAGYDEEEVEEADEEEEYEYDALMALTDAKDLKARLTVAVITRMQPDNLIRVFIKCAEFGKWPNKTELVAFLVRIDGHPPRTGASKVEVVVLVKEVLGNNS